MVPAWAGRKTFRQKPAKKQGYKAALIIRMMVSVFFLCSETQQNQQKGDGNVDTSGYKQTEEKKEDMGNTVFGRGHDSMELMARFGYAGYMQKFYEFLQGKFHPENIMAEDAPNLSRDQAWHVIYCMKRSSGLHWIITVIWIPLWGMQSPVFITVTRERCTA